jgi:hypothetical protein
VVAANIIDPRATRPVAPFSSSARRAANFASAKRRKISPRTGWEYCAAVSPLFARNSSAAAQRRFSSAAVAVSFEAGAIQRMCTDDTSTCQLVPSNGDAISLPGPQVSHPATLGVSQ